MTFIPSVITKYDANNSDPTISALSFIGTSTLTTGYNSIVLTISSPVNSTNCGIQIQFSNDGTTFQTMYSDTYFANSKFTKTYPIVDIYYRISYISSSSTSFTINTILSTSPVNSENNSITAFDNNIESSLDAFGKLRVTQPNTLLDIRFPGQSSGTSGFLSNSEMVSSLASGSVSATYSNSQLDMYTTGTGYYISQSRNYTVYQPGKSLLFMMSAVMDAYNYLVTGGNNGANVISRVGYYDCSYGTSTVYNGLYFQYQGGVCSVCLSNLGSQTSVTQSNWNIDKMDGTGTSGLNLDFTKAQLFVIDMEWLSIGRIRYGFYAYGKVHYAHQITNVNALFGPYTTNINLPISTTIVGSSGQNGAMIQICSTVISEGGYNPVGKPYSISNQAVAVSVPSRGEEIPLIALRGGGPNYYHQNIIPTGLSVLSITSTDYLLYKLRLYQDGNLGGTTITWTDVSNNSVAQYSLGTSITNFNAASSYILDQDYFSGKTMATYSSLTDIFNDKITHITANASNVSDVLILTAIKISGGGSPSNVYATMNWQEIY